MNNIQKFKDVMQEKRIPPALIEQFHFPDNHVCQAEDIVAVVEKMDALFTHE